MDLIQSFYGARFALLADDTFLHSGFFMDLVLVLEMIVSFCRRHVVLGMIAKGFKRGVHN